MKKTEKKAMSIPSALCQGAVRRLKIVVVSSFETSQNFTESYLVSERCDTLDVLLQRGCTPQQLEFPLTRAEVLKEIPLGRSEENRNHTHISPQKMALKLRPGTSYHDHLGPFF